MIVDPVKIRQDRLDGMLSDSVSPLRGFSTGVPEFWEGTGYAVGKFATC